VKCELTVAEIAVLVRTRAQELLALWFLSAATD